MIEEKVIGHLWYIKNKKLYAYIANRWMRQTTNQSCSTGDHGKK